MLKRTQLAIFKKYRGDEDGFSRVATITERAVMKGVAWAEIADLIQRARMVRGGKASSEFERELKQLMSGILEPGIAIDDLVG